MKRDVATYTIVGALVAVAILLIYSSTFQFTGLVVFNQQAQTDFDEGTYLDVIYDSNASAVVLDVNQTSGTYTSKIFNASEEAMWNNLTWTGRGDLDFEVRVCTSSDCANESFAGADLADLNLTAQYFQYKVLFTEDPNLTVSLETVSVDYSISEPEPSCDYEHLDLCLASEDCGVVEGYWYNDVCNAEEASCSNSLNLCDETNCVGVGSGFWYGDVCNELECSSDAQCDSAYECSEDGVCVEWFADEGEGEEGEEAGEVIIDLSPPAPTLVTRLTVTDVSDQVLNPNQTKQITLSFRNDGETTLTSCTFGIVDSSSLVTHENGEKSLNPGQEEEFVFDISIPENTEEGQHSLTAMVTCSQRSSSTMFVVDVVEKKLEFELIDVQRTRDDRVRVIYSLEELAGNNQNVEFVFSLVGANEVEVGMVQVNQSINANSFKEFRTNININETLLPINETTNETLESELTLNVNYDSLIYSSSVQEKVLIGAPIGFAIFGGIGAGSAVILLVVVLALAVVLFVARRMRKSGKTLGSLIKK